jgi:predicted aspartyl protease
MGRVLTPIIVENLEDLWAVMLGIRAADEVRHLAIDDALVDTGATTLSLPTNLIQRLGLSCRATKPIRTRIGPSMTKVYDAVRLTIMGRDCTVDVMEVPDGVPPLVGQVPLELLDLVVDPARQRLIGNPAHGGEHVIEMY